MGLCAGLQFLWNTFMLKNTKQETFALQTKVINIITIQKNVKENQKSFSQISSLITILWR